MRHLLWYVQIRKYETFNGEQILQYKKTKFIEIVQKHAFFPFQSSFTYGWGKMPNHTGNIPKIQYFRCTIILVRYTLPKTHNGMNVHILGYTGANIVNRSIQKKLEYTTYTVYTEFAIYTLKYLIYRICDHTFSKSKFTESFDCLYPILYNYFVVIDVCLTLIWLHIFNSSQYKKPNALIVHLIN